MKSRIMKLIRGAAVRYGLAKALLSLAFMVGCVGLAQAEVIDVASPDELATKVANASSGDTLNLAASETAYSLYESGQNDKNKGKSLTFIGATDADGQPATTWVYGSKADMSGEHGADYCFDGAGTIVFKNVILKDNYSENKYYRGFVRPANMVFENCKFLNMAGYWGVGTVSFKDCVFDVADVCEYSLKLYSGKNFYFDGCTFKGNKKGFIQAYTEATNAYHDVYIKDCTFTKVADTVEKTAIYFYDHSYGEGSYWNIYFTGTNKSDVDLWGSMKTGTSNPDETVIYVNGVKVWAKGLEATPSTETRVATEEVSVKEEGTETSVAVTANTVASDAVKSETTSDLTATMSVANTGDNKVFTSSDTDAKPVLVKAMGIGTVTFNTAAVEKIAANAGTAETISIKVSDITPTATGTGDGKIAAASDATIVVSVDVTANSASLYSEQNAAGSATVTIPYTGTNPKVYLVSGSTATEVASTYDATACQLSFTVQHFTDYAVKEASSSTTPTYVAQVGEEKYEDLAEALKAANDAKATCTLMCDIDFNQTSWTPISSFAGTFDGAGHVIKNFTVTDTSSNIGFFNSVNGATIKDITFDGAIITPNSTDCNVGVLAGALSVSTVENVIIKNAVINHTDGHSEHVGALGGTSSSTILNCQIVDSVICGADQVGAAIGYQWCNGLNDCLVSGCVITATSERAGGLIGKLQCSSGNDSYFTVQKNTVSDTTVTAPDMAGGLMGQLMGDMANYEIKDNTVDATLTAPVTSPIGVLRNEDMTTFVNVLESNVTGNSWTYNTAHKLLEETDDYYKYSSESYTYAEGTTLNTTHGCGAKTLNNATPSIVTVPKDTTKTTQSVTTQKSTSSVAAASGSVAQTMSAQATVGDTTKTIAQNIATSTTVSGVKLTATEKTATVSGQTEKATGLDAVIAAAKTAATAASNTEFVDAADKTTNTLVHVDVKVTPTAYVAPVAAAEGVTKVDGQLAFKLEPKATVTVYKTTTDATTGETTTEAKTQIVDVTNDMIDQTQKISVSVYAGFQPLQINHNNDDGTLIEKFTGDAIAYDKTTGIATVKVSHFSTLTLFGAVQPNYVAAVISADGAPTTKYETLAVAFAAATVGSTVTLLSDIDMTGVEWTPPQLGAITVDGNGKTISNLTVSNSNDYTGLFRLLQGTTIKDLTLDKCSITGNRVGVLAGAADSFTVTNVKVTNSMVTGVQKCAGLVGYVRTGAAVDIENCEVATLNIRGTDEDGVWQAGGLIGYLQMATGTISGNKVSGISIVDAYKTYHAKGGFSHQFESHAFIADIVNCSDTESDYETKVLTLSNNTIEQCSEESVYREIYYTTFCGDYANWSRPISSGSKFPTKLVVDGVEVTKAYASIDDTKYASLADAIAAVQSGETITLLADNAEEITVTTTVPFSINANGKALSGSVTPASGYHFVVKNGTCAYRALVYNVTPATAQDVLDSIQEGETILLGTGDYEVLYLRQTVANSTTGTDLDQMNADFNADWSMKASYPSYYRCFKNLTIKSADGATVTCKGIKAEAGLFNHTTAPASNTTDVHNGNFTSYLQLTNVTIDGIGFDTTDGNSCVVLRDNGANGNFCNYLVDGFTVQNCKATGDVTKTGLHFFSAGSGTNGKCFPGTEKTALNNIAIKNNTLNSFYQPICHNNTTATVTGYTITGNTFNNCVDNQIQMSNGKAAGAWVITNNSFVGLAGRVLRLTNAAADSTFTITGNTITNPVGYDSGADSQSITKISGVKGFIVTEQTNEGGWGVGAYTSEAQTTWVCDGDTSLLKYVYDTNAKGTATVLKLGLYELTDDEVAAFTGVNVKGVKGYDNKVYPSMQAAYDELSTVVIAAVDYETESVDVTVMANTFSDITADNKINFTWSLWGAQTMPDEKEVLTCGRECGHFSNYNIRGLTIQGMNASAAVNDVKTIGIPWSWWSDQAENHTEDVVLSIYNLGVTDKTTDGISIKRDVTSKNDGGWRPGYSGTFTLNMTNCTVRGGINMSGGYSHNLVWNIKNNVFTKRKGGYATNAIMINGVTVNTKGESMDINFIGNIVSGYDRSLNFNGYGNLVIANNTITPGAGYSAVQLCNGASAVITNNTINLNGGNVLTIHDTYVSTDNEAFTAVIAVTNNTISGTGYAVYDDVNKAGMTYGTVVDGSDANVVLAWDRASNVCSTMNTKQGIKGTTVCELSDYVYYVLNDPAATIDDTKYRTLQAAIDAVTENQTIVLQSANAETITMTKTVPFSINANGYTLSGSVAPATDWKFVVDETTGTCSYQACDYVAQIGTTKFATLADAVAAVNNNETITVIADITETSYLLINNGKTFTVDFGGHEVAYNPVWLYSGYVTFTHGTLKCSVYQRASATDAAYNALTIAKNMVVESDFGVVMYQRDVGENNFGSTLTVDGTINASAGIWVMGNIHTDLASAVNPITVNVNGTVNATSEGIALMGSVVVNVNEGATIDAGTEAVSMKSGELNVLGGTLTAKGDKVDPVSANDNGAEDTGAAISLTSNYNGYAPMSVNISGGTIESKNNAALYVGHSTKSGSPVAYVEGVTVNVTGGQFKGGANQVAVYCADKLEGDCATYPSQFLSGGIYSASPATTYLAAGYSVMDNPDTTTNAAYPWMVAAGIDKGNGSKVPAVEEKVTTETKVDTSVVEDEEVKAAIETETVVEGVKLTTTDTTNAYGVVVTPAGLQAVVDAAKVANAALKTAIESPAASMVTVKVDVVVSPSIYVAPVVEDSVVKTAGKIAYTLSPTATVTVVTKAADGTTSSVKQLVEVTNDMIDKDHPITVSIYTGFEPKKIVHTADSGTVIETFTGDGITYNEGVATVQISHFSGLTAYQDEDVVLYKDLTVTPTGATEAKTVRVYETFWTDATISDADKQTALNATAANGLQVWENYVMGLQTTQATAVGSTATLKPVASNTGAGQTTVKITAAMGTAMTVPGDSGYTVTYSLLKMSGTSGTVYDTQAKPVFTVDTAGLATKTQWKIRVNITPAQ